MGKLPIAVLALLIIPLLIIPTQATTSNISLNEVYYHKYSSLLVAEYQNSSVVSIKNEVYVVNNETYIGNGSHVEITGYHTVYAISLGSLTQYSGNVNITTYVNGSLLIYSSVPYLARVIVTSGDMEELVWSGLATSPTTIVTSAYINGTGTIVLQYLNGTSFANVTLNVKESGKISKNITLTLYQITASLNTVTSYTSILNIQVPRKYTPLIQSLYVNGSNVSANSNGYVIGYAYFNGTLLPSIEWKGLGLGSMHMPGLTKDIKFSVNFTTIEFYGANGTVVGYVHSSYVSAGINSSMSLLLLKTMKEINYVSGELTIVYVSNNYLHSNSAPIIIVYHNKLPVVVIVSNGSVETTADVSIAHEVSINTSHGVLAELAINSTSFYIVIINGHAHNVSNVSPKVNVTHVTISGNTYLAQEVEVNGSEYIVFNVTALGNTFTVFKVVNGKYVELNSTNYFEVNGKIVVFDDPTNTYLVVYGYTPSSSTTSSSTTFTSSSTTSATSFNETYLGIAIAIIIVVVILAIVFLTRRK